MKFVLLLTLFLSVNSFKAVNQTDRRVFFGDPKYDYRPPWSSVITFRVLKHQNGQLVQHSQCTGVLIGPNRALTAAHCAMNLPPESTLKVGYSSTRYNQQQLMDVSRVHFCEGIDILVVELANDIPANQNLEFFTMDRWKAMDQEIVFHQTFMCGYGLYEGPDAIHPTKTRTDVLRCLAYHTNGNYERMVDQANTYPAEWLRPSPSDGVIRYDSRYMCSLSLDPMNYKSHENDPSFSTACAGDSGAPVFYKDSDGKIWLYGIHHAGLRINDCGKPSTNSIKYDTAAYVTTAARRDCTENF